MVLAFNLFIFFGVAQAFYLNCINKYRRTFNKKLVPYYFVQTISYILSALQKNLSFKSERFVLNLLAAII